MLIQVLDKIREFNSSTTPNIIEEKLLSHLIIVVLGDEIQTYGIQEGRELLISQATLLIRIITLKNSMELGLQDFIY